MEENSTPETSTGPSNPFFKTIVFVFALGVIIFAGYQVFQGFQKQKLFPSASPGQEEKVFCQEPRPQVCTMECLQNPPYLCGLDGKSYCSACQACSNPKVEWYLTRNNPCEIQ